MLDFSFQAKFAIAIAECVCKLRFQPAETVDLLPYIPHLAREHRLHFGTSVMLLAQR